MVGIGKAHAILGLLTTKDFNFRILNLMDLVTARIRTFCIIRIKFIRILMLRIAEIEDAKLKIVKHSSYNGAFTITFGQSR